MLIMFRFDLLDVSQHYSFNIMFKNTMWYLIACFYVEQAQNEKNVNSDIYTEVTNYSLTISAFNSVPDNSVSELGKQCLQFVLKLLLFLLIEKSKMS